LEGQFLRNLYLLKGQIMNHFAEKMEEFLKEAASDAVKDQISDAIDDMKSDMESEIEDAKYSMEQMVDSAISDMHSDVINDVMADVDQAIDDRLEKHKAINPPLNSDDMRWIKDYIDGLIKERLSQVFNELAKFTKPLFIPNRV